MIEHIDCINKIILDLGSGTGILAIYSMMHGAKHAVAVDTDEWAFENSKENCKRNGYEEDLIELRLGELSTVVKPQEYFEIVIANIHRNVLLTIYDEIAAHQISNGILVLSGILEYDAAEITDQYEAIGYRLIERLQENEWVCLRFEFTKP
jgi:ribosomal protein L11 methyltransferase